jgi:hypothetical protein
MGTLHVRASMPVTISSGSVCDLAGLVQYGFAALAYAALIALGRGGIFLAQGPHPGGRGRRRGRNLNYRD